MFTSWIFSVYLAASSADFLAWQQLSPAASTATESEPLVACDLKELRPTEMALGQRQVLSRVKGLRPLLEDPEKLRKFLRENYIPSVAGPDHTLFVLDHHHLARTLIELGLTASYCKIEKNWSLVGWRKFWQFMYGQGWLYLFDEQGEGPLGVKSLPRSLSDMKDDPYRSLAGSVREAGGFKKSDVPYAEFQWANFFREKIEIEPGDDGFQQAVELGLTLARDPEAANLPGFIGGAR